MLRKAAVVASASAVLLATNVAAAQGVNPVNPPNPNAPNAAAPGNQQMGGLAEFTGTVKDYDTQGRVITMDNGMNFYIQGNDPVPGGNLIRPGAQLTVFFVFDPNMQGQRAVRQIVPAPQGAPPARP